MSRIGLVGPSYTSQSRNADDQLTINLYSEAIESGSGKVQAALYCTPGEKVSYTLPDLPIRGELTTNGRAFAVGGSSVCELFTEGTFDYRGTIVNDGKPVSMAVGPTQILIASGGTGYVLDLNTNLLSTIAPGTLTNIKQVAFCDGFFLAIFFNSDKLQVSGLEDATSWDPLAVSQVNVFVDNILAILVDHENVWQFGVTKTVCYYNAGTAPFPFAYNPGAFIEQGIVAANSAVQLDNSVFWLGGDQRGAGVAWRANGFTPQRVSNHAVEFAWQSYARIDDAVGYSYQDQGHSFWVLYFPTPSKTWVLDVENGQWHERGYWNAVNGIFTAHRSQNHMYVFGKHLVGDWATGNIYQMSINFLDDFGNPIRRVRRTPHVSTEQEWIFHHQLQIDLETGLGPQPPLTGNFDGPQTLVLQDELGQLWTVTIDDSGQLHSIQSAIGNPTNFYIQDNVNGEIRLLGILSNGMLTGTLAPYIPSAPQSFPMATTPSFFQSGIFLTDKKLQTSPGLASNPRDPMLNLRFSDDGGHTWSNEISVGVGQAGNYRKRAMFYRLGRSRDRVYELSMSDPIPWRLLEADLKASPGFSESERLVTQIRKSA